MEMESKPELKNRRTFSVPPQTAVYHDFFNRIYGLLHLFTTGCLNDF